MKSTLLKLIDSRTKGVDTYHNNGSMWLIFTDEKKWVIELTKEGTLWYNFYFFQDCFKYVSLDVVENQHYITEWVENFIQNGVKHTRPVEIYVENSVETIIQNGIKETKHNTFEDGLAMEEVIQNGVKRTELGGKDRKIDEIKDIVENGIKETNSVHIHNGESIDSVIQNGIKETKRLKDDNRPQIGNIIKQTNWRKVEHFPDYTDRVTKKG